MGIKVAPAAEATRNKDYVRRMVFLTCHKHEHREDRLSGAATKKENLSCISTRHRTSVNLKVSCALFWQESCVPDYKLDFCLLHISAWVADKGYNRNNNFKRCCCSFGCCFCYYYHYYHYSYYHHHFYNCYSSSSMRGASIAATTTTRLPLLLIAYN